MDGTLIDSRADLAATVNHTRRDLGLVELPQEDILCHVGHGAKYLLAHAIPEAVDLDGRAEARPSRADAQHLNISPPNHPTISTPHHLNTSTPQLLNTSTPQLLNIFMSHYGEHMLESVALYPGVKETLEELHGKGVLLGVNTAKPRFATMAILDHFGLTPLFAGAIIAGGDCAEMKPSPLPLRQCAALMPDQTLDENDWMIGDNWTDIKCAMNASIKSAFCNYGFGVLADSTPTVRIDKFSDILSLCCHGCGNQ